MTQKHYVNTAILWFALTFIGELLLQAITLPLLASDEGLVIDNAFRILFVLGVPVLTFVVSVMSYSLINFRARGSAVEVGATIHGSNTFSLIWLVITGALAVTVIIHPGITGLAELGATNTSPDTVIRITSSRWSWRVEYPDGASSREELILPVDQRVKFEVTSTDVLHSFWIPAFRLKIDAVPGLVTEMYVTPSRTGSYATDATLRVQCAELCGLDHATMQIPVRVVEQAEFDAASGGEGFQAADTPEARGRHLADKMGCVGCHSVDGSVSIGPSWLGVYGSERSLADGALVTVDEDYLRESILDPNARVVEGFAPNMMPPTFGDTLTGEQIGDLIAYIKSLGE
ncbi:MAG: cytochrome c oxidase subunit II [Anaerolineales bacterium]